MVTYGFEVMALPKVGSMGPTLIFDKSALQCLSADESIWLDQFFIANITPLFFVETLADLEKEIRSGKTPEQAVGIIADKTPDMSSIVNTYHANLLYGELAGLGDVEMSGRPIISGGRHVKLGNESGVIFQEAPEVEAFHRWQKREFLQVERTIAKNWRSGLAALDPESHKPFFKIFFDKVGIPKSLKELRAAVDHVLDAPNQRQVLAIGLSVIGVIPSAQDKVLSRWDKSDKKSVRNFAPYFAHVLMVDLFY